MVNMRLGLRRETRCCTILLDTERAQFGSDNNFPEDNPMETLDPGGNRTSLKGMVNMRLGLRRETRCCTILLDTEQHQYGSDNNFPEDNPMEILDPGGNRTSLKGKVNMRLGLWGETRRCTILRGRARAQTAR
jgi:hypothetical protein